MSSRSPQNTLNNTPTLITLTYAGDVILKLGGHEQPVIRLLCSSVCLSHGSSVFKAMFRPDRFAEGQDLSFTSPPEVPLPEDDPDSVKRLCEILHSQPGDHDEWICTNHYAEFAIVVDKYDCRNATLPWFKMHFHHILAPKSCPDTEKLLFVCYVLDFPKEFEAVTKQLMLNHNRPIDPLTAMHDTDLVPLKFLRDLEQRRKLNVEKVARALEPWFVRNVTLRHSSFRIEHVRLPHRGCTIWLSPVF
ncbi:hypothetical protein SLS60_005818 [Paraconiothyrium brasiliense]|uniref:BTB domain-containing protein n=1 Tax=Paraconiothyrium brasiliense TaxID=300254 RepID=A0ABR3RDG3_9PLEO